MTNKTPGWIGPRDPDRPHLDIGYADGNVVNCTDHDRGDCLLHEPVPAEHALTDAEKLAALETYLKVLKSTADTLRASVTTDMRDRNVERVGAYLPDGTKMASVSYSDGRKAVRVIDEAGALAWAERNYPDEVQTVRTIRPGFLKKLLDVAGSLPVGSMGLDSATGELLPFIQVQQGNPYVTVTTTKDGVNRMATLAGGFVAMLEAGR